MKARFKTCSIESKNSTRKKLLVARYIVGLAVVFLLFACPPNGLLTDIQDKVANANSASSPTYTITYNGNGNTGGSVPVDTAQYKQGQTATVQGNPGNLVKTNYTFNGWNTQADGNGTTYTQGQTITIGNSNITLHAKWTSLPTYTVTYNGNGNTGGNVPVDSTNYLQNQTVTVLGNIGSLTETGKAFKNWNTASNGTGTSYNPGQQFTMGTSNVILYAQWVTAYAVTYNGNGNTGGSVPVDPNSYVQGSLVTVLGNTGGLANGTNQFAGWTTNPNATGASLSYATGATFTIGSSSVTLYAIWIPSGISFTSVGTIVALIGYTTAPTGAFTIPPGVTSLGVSSLANCPGLTSITIPSSVTSIGDNALMGNAGLTSITIPSSVTSIGLNVFSACSNLTSIAVDASNPNYSSLSGVLFNKVQTTLIQAPGGLTGSYGVPSTVIAIGGYSFQGCSKLTSINLPSSVTTIGAYSFANCSGLTSFTFPPSLTSIGDAAFYACSNLTSIAIPSSVTSIGIVPFKVCGKLTSITVAAANPNYSAVSGVLFDKAQTHLIEAPTAMTGTYSIPAGVTSVGDWSFYQCNSLTSVTITSGVTSIGDYAFCLCLMSNIVIPSTVTSIGMSAFRGCTGATSATVLALTPPTMPLNSLAFDNEVGGFLIHVPSGTVAAYQAAAGWSSYKSEIVSP